MLVSGDKENQEQLKQARLSKHPRKDDLEFPFRVDWKLLASRSEQTKQCVLFCWIPCYPGEKADVIHNKHLARIDRPAIC